MEQNTNSQQDDKSSSSEELEIEPQNSAVIQKPNQSQEHSLDIRNFIEQGELMDMLIGQKWVTVIVHGINQMSLLVSPANQSQNKSMNLQHNSAKQQEQWVDFDFLIFRKQWIPGVQLYETCRVEIKNSIQGWLEATIVEAQANQIKVHYNGYKQIYDEFLPFSNNLINNLIAPLGTFTKTLGMGTLLKQQSQQLNKFVHRYHTCMQEWSQYAKKKLYHKLETSFPQLLFGEGLIIKQIGGDGNCMFRAVSDQLYGTEIYYRELRMFAIQYITIEQKYFQNFVVGGDIEKYLAYKSQDGVWGDNIELQAFRELYDIPIEVYVYSTTPLKTGLETNPKNQEYIRMQIQTRPIRISYHGKSHYNSIKPFSEINRGLLGERHCGEAELKMLSKLKKENDELIQNKENESQLSSRLTSQSLLGRPNMMEDVYNESKLMFEQELKKKESQQFIEDDTDEQLLDMVIKESTHEIQQAEDNHQFQQDETLDSQIMQGIMEESKKNQQQEQDRQLDKMIDESALEKAIKDSVSSHEANIYEDPLNNPIIAQVMSMGHFTLDMVLEAYTVAGHDPDMMMIYIFENFM